MNNVYKLIYCSRNRIGGTSEEVIGVMQQILASARVNNARLGITGALLFNEGLFAQALEGPLDSVERIFEKIQRDPRHSDVTVLQSGAAEQRDFPEWSMAFASRKGEPAPALNTALSDPSQAGAQVLNLLRDVVVQEDWMLG